MRILHLGLRGIRKDADSVSAAADPLVFAEVVGSSAPKFANEGGVASASGPLGPEAVWTCVGGIPTMPMAVLLRR